MKYEVFAKGKRVGWSFLEHGDPPMGVAFGKFFPCDNYSQIEKTVKDETIGDQEKTLGLTIIAADSYVFQPVGGIRITDDSDALGEEGREIEVCGLHWEIYQKYFGEHLSAYAKKYHPATDWR